MKRILSLMCLLWMGMSGLFAADKPFVVVLDAGHGGKDAGAIGYTLKKLEKDINLKVYNTFFEKALIHKLIIFYLLFFLKAEAIYRNLRPWAENP